MGPAEAILQTGARVSVDVIDEMEAHFQGVDFAVEFALPYKTQDFLAIGDRMQEVRDPRIPTMAPPPGEERS